MQIRRQVLMVSIPTSINTFGIWLGMIFSKQAKGGWMQGAPKQCVRYECCLLPKVNYPTRTADLCPISLCSVLYRIIAKVLANFYSK
ncbi:hypothetical protein LINGRAHAP2_LOCUS1993 [Linum grandiflorum]